MIAVTGASGHLGKLVIQQLLKKVPAEQIMALVRNPEKGEELKKLGLPVRKADYSQPSTLLSALQGVTQLLLISSSEIGQRVQQHQAVIQSAVQTGVKKIIYTSVLKADASTLGLAKEHLETEKMILASGLQYTILRNGWYLENHTENMAAALSHSVVLGAARDGKFSSASRADYAAAAVAVLTQSGHEQKIYELAGDQSFTLSEYAAKLGQLSGKSIVYQDMPVAEFEKVLLSFGLPAGLANLLADSDAGAAVGGLYSEQKDLSRLIGRPTTSLVESIKSHL